MKAGEVNKINLEANLYHKITSEVRVTSDTLITFQKPQMSILSEIR